MIDVKTTTITCPGLYKWDGIKRTRKAAYTHYLTYYNKDYSNCSRKYKRLRKRCAVRGLYYNKGKILIFHPKLLSMPIPKGIMEAFSFKPFPVTSGQTMRFRRYSEMT